MSYLLLILFSLLFLTQKERKRLDNDLNIASNYRVRLGCLSITYSPMVSESRWLVWRKAEKESETERGGEGVERRCWRLCP